MDDYVEKQPKKIKREITEKQRQALAQNREKARLKILENKKKLDLLNSYEKAESKQKVLESVQKEYLIDPNLVNKLNSIENILLMQKKEKEEKRKRKEIVKDYPEKKFTKEYINNESDPNEKKPDNNYDSYDTYEEPVYVPKLNLFR